MLRTITHGLMEVRHVPTDEHIALIDTSIHIAIPEDREDEWKNELETLIKRFAV